jgi:hypothetical protein
MAQIEIRPGVIRAELAKSLTEIDAQIEEIKNYASNLNIPVVSLRDANTNWVYIPLLVAKANALSALAQLQAK